MSDHQAVYPVRTMCRLLGLSPSGYYAWRQRGLSRRARENSALTEEILEIHTRSDETYGAPRIHAELRARGRGASLNRVARLMRAARIEGVSRRRRGKTTRRASGGAARGRSGRAGLLGLGPRRTLGGRHHVRSHSGGLPLPRGGGGTPGAAGWWAGRWRRT